MKINLWCFFLLIIIASQQIYSQEENELDFGVGEIYVGTRGLNLNEQVSYKMDAVGSLWGGGPLDFPPSPYILNPTNPSYRNATASRDSIQFFPNTIFSLYNWPYFRMIALDGPLNINSFGYGVYKFYIEQYSAYFYIDYRDNNYFFYNNCPGGNCNDIWVKYERSLDKFYYMPYDGDANNPDDPDWILISNGELLFYYNIQAQQSPGTSSFPNYWQNCLVVIPSEDGNSPRLVWGPIPNFQADGYKIYWSLNTQGGPPEGFGLLAEVGPNTYEYTHKDIAINGNWKAYYKVKAYNSTSESGFTNTVEIGVRGFFKDKGNSYTDTYNEFTLHSNYPNPFNPITKIEFTVTSQSPVEIKVYDPFGREIKTLVNEMKDIGTHEIKFDGSNLPSGIYFLIMKAGSFTDVKKMLLVK